MERGLPHTFFTMPTFTFHHPLPDGLITHLRLRLGN